MSKTARKLPIDTRPKNYVVVPDRGDPGCWKILDRSGQTVAQAFDSEADAEEWVKDQ